MPPGPEPRSATVETPLHPQERASRQAALPEDEGPAGDPDDLTSEPAALFRAKVCLTGYRRTPLADIPVQLTLMDGRTLEAVTGPEGGLEVELPPGVTLLEAEVRAGPDRRWRLDQRDKLRRHDPARGREFVFGIVETVEDSLSGLTVRASSGEPLAGVGIRFQWSDVGRTVEARSLVSDANGAFHLPGPLPKGWLSITTAPKLSHRYHVRRDPHGGPLRLEIASDAAPIEIRLLGHRPPDALFTVWVLEAGTDRCAGHGTLKQRDGRSWLHPRMRTSTPAKTRLVVLDNRGFSAGSTEIPGETFTSGGPITIELRPTAALQIQCELEEHADLPADYKDFSDEQKRLSTANWDPVGYPERELVSDLDPSLPLADLRRNRLQWLPPGHYRWRVRARNRETVTGSIFLEGGRRTDVSATLKKLHDLRDVRGSLRLQGLDTFPPVSVTMQLQGVSGPSWSATYDPLLTCGTGIDAWILVDKGARPPSARFEWTEVPRGSLELSIDSREARGTVVQGNHKAYR